jgi:hypothetical protein
MQRSDSLCVRLAGVMLAAGIFVTASTSVRAAEPLVTISGGGTASFDDIEGLESQFSVGAVIRDDGTIDGHFMCMIVAVVTVSGDVTGATWNDDGTVTLSGVAHGVEHTPDSHAPFDNCKFNVTLREGGPGVGGFVYQDCVVPPPGDAETIEQGQIAITVH